MRTLLALRGIGKKGNIEAWEQGGLEVVPGSLRVQGVAQKWRGKVAQGESWNIGVDEEEHERPRIDGDEGSCVKKGAIVAMVNERQLVPWSGGGNTPAKQPSQLREILCCRCNKVRQLGNAKLFTKTCFFINKMSRNILRHLDGQRSMELQMYDTMDKMS